MGNGISSADMRWGPPEAAMSFTNNGEASEAPGVGGTFYDTNGDEIDGGFGGGGSGARWAAGGAGGYSGKIFTLDFYIRFLQFEGNLK
jgi:hypothetical protein